MRAVRLPLVLLVLGLLIQVGWFVQIVEPYRYDLVASARTLFGASGFAWLSQFVFLAILARMLGFDCLRRRKRSRLALFVGLAWLLGVSVHLVHSLVFAPISFDQYANTTDFRCGVFLIFSGPPWALGLIGAMVVAATSSWEEVVACEEPQ